MAITQASISQGDEYVLAQQVVDYLQLAFPGYPWVASVHQGVLYIKNLLFEGNWGMQCRVDKVDKRGVLNCGDELLRRFNMPSRCTEAAIADMKRDFTGKPISEKWTPDRRYYNKASQTWKA